MLEKALYDRASPSFPNCYLLENLLGIKHVPELGKYKGCKENTISVLILHFSKVKTQAGKLCNVMVLISAAKNTDCSGYVARNLNEYEEKTMLLRDVF